ncbi:helix-turn-helix domain-containing protein [Limnobacter sp.]|uniref:helix-turn-helix domain-containing protein n=1 Tax=Limnobacter sp. TaxID=2003368 RepID=UPI0035110373
MNDNRAMNKTEAPDSPGYQDSKSESGAYTAPEKHPNLTLLESGQNPGEILKQAREKAGYSLSDISAQTKINERQLEAIESGDISRLPPETFAKAFIKSYCKALRMDPAPVIASFGFSGSADATAARAQAADSTRVDPLEPKMPSSSKRLSSLNFDRKTGKKSLSYGIVLAAVALMAMFYIPVFLSSETEEVVTPTPVDVVPADPSDALVAEQSALPAASVPLPLEPNATTDGQNSVFPALQQPAGEAPAAPGAQQTPAAAGSAAPTASAPTASSQPQATQPSAAATGESSLSFKFAEQSWVTVRDANDKVLLSQLNDGGTSLTISGQAPFKLIVGNAQTVSLSHNGKPVDLSQSIRGEVARLTVQ